MYHELSSALLEIPTFGNNSIIITINRSFIVLITLVAELK